MSKKPETKFREKIDRELEKIPFSWFESIQQKTIRATPDKIGCVNSLFVALEIKADEESHIDALQEYKIHRITNHAKGIACIVTPSNYKAIIRELIKLSTKEIKYV